MEEKRRRLVTLPLAARKGDGLDEALGRQLDEQQHGNGIL
jgi:hypothetical protein